MVTLLGVIVMGRAVPGPAGGCVAGMRAAVIAAVAGRLLWVVIGRWLVSAGGGWERFEALERCLELGDPRPGVL